MERERHVSTERRGEVKRGNKSGKTESEETGGIRQRSRQK